MPRSAMTRAAAGSFSKLSRNGVVAIDPQEAWDNHRRFIAYGYGVSRRVPIWELSPTRSLS
jgi:hypothetical protein